MQIDSFLQNIIRLVSFDWAKKIHILPKCCLYRFDNQYKRLSELLRNCDGTFHLTCLHPGWKM